MGWLGALPARFRRERVLIVGCGDVGQRVAGVLGAGQRLTVRALTSSGDRRAELRACGITPLLGNLDDARSLARLAGLATRVLHLAPPPSGESPHDHRDPRTRALVRALVRRSLPGTLVYGSTSGVYGDQQGRWVSEATPVQPPTPRAGRRVDAEFFVHWLGRATGVLTQDWGNSD